MSPCEKIRVEHFGMHDLELFLDGRVCEQCFFASPVRGWEPGEEGLDGSIETRFPVLDNNIAMSLEV